MKGSLVIAATGPGVASLKDALQTLDSPRLRFIEPLSDNAWARCWFDPTPLVSLREAARHTSCPSKTFRPGSFISCSGWLAGGLDLESSSSLKAVVWWAMAAWMKPGDSLEWMIIQRLIKWFEEARMAARTRWDMRVLANRWDEFLQTTPGP